jgi:hypothetical protein
VLINDLTGQVVEPSPADPSTTGGAGTRVPSHGPVELVEEDGARYAVTEHGKVRIAVPDCPEPEAYATSQAAYIALCDGTLHAQPFAGGAVLTTPVDPRRTPEPTAITGQTSFLLAAPYAVVVARSGERTLVGLAD